MKSPIFKLALGLLLCGCTVNSVRIHSKLTIPTERAGAVNEVVDSPTVEKNTSAPTDNALAVPVTVPKSRIKPGCGAYRPPPVPDPIRIDMKKLEAAADATEINAIALAAVAALHKQLENYAVVEKRSFESYKKRCVNK